jgi:ABC-type uncharacterized transport system involved in gliding motility auxiliary subunit
MLNRIVGIVGWIGTALVFAGVGVRFARPEMQGVARGLLWGGLACLLVYILGQWRDIGKAFGRRQTRYGTLATASVLIVIGILIGINWLSYRQNKRWDLTANKQFTLSDQTKKVLENLKAPVRFKVFEKEQEFDRFRSMLDEYKYAGKQVSVEYIDPDKQNAIAKQYQIQSYGTVVIEYQNRTERVTSAEEQELTNGLIKAVEGQQKKVYFIQGHGEKDTASSERSGYHSIAEALGRDNFTVEKLVLAQQTDVPADAAVIVIAGPTGDYLPTEIDAIKRYLAKGGKALVLLDPPQTGNAPGTPNLVALLKEWNIDVGSNLVVDVSGVGQLFGTDASVPVAAPPYPNHAITERFNVMTAYPLARSVTASNSGEGGGRSPQPIVQTGPRSWAETDIARVSTSGEVALEEAKGDKPGPVSIGVAVSAPAETATTPPPKPGETPDKKTPETRLAVIGDSDFVANYILGFQGNRDMFMNTVNWLAQQENLIAVRPHEPEDRRITMTVDQQRRIALLTIFLIPGIILAAGVRSWWRRR